MSRLTITALRIAGGFALACAGAAPAVAAHKEISPYIELTQVLTADQNDVLTYSEVAAGVDAELTTHNAAAQLSYRYERRISWDDDIGDDDIHTGLARAAVQLTPTISVEGGAIATRARSDIRGAAPSFFDGNGDNITQVYAAYVGPSLATHVGPVGVGASYYYGYTKVEVPDSTGIGPGQQPLDYYDDSSSHLLQASAGVKPGDVLPVGLTVSGAYEREDAGQLDQRYEGKFVRGDVLAPISPTVALAGGIGYEKIEISQRDPLVDGDGNPVTDRHGRFQTDPNSPKRIAYNTDGIFWDAGVVWHPSPRTQVEGYVGHRYGSMSYTGSISYQASETVGMAVQVYDNVQTFGRQLRQGLQNLPTSFIGSGPGLGQQYNGCVFGTSGSAVGGCLDDVFQSVSTASYHARGIDGIVYASRGPLRMGVGAGYANRKLFSPDNTPGIVLYGIEDQSYYGQFFVARALDAQSTIEGDVFVNYYDPGFAGSNGIFSTGAIGTYNRNFGRLDATASIGVYTFDQKDLDSEVSAEALLGMRYQF